MTAQGQILSANNVLAAVGLTLIAGCSSTTSSVSTYAPNLKPTVSSVANFDDREDQFMYRNERALARSAPQKFDYDEIYAAKFDGNVSVEAFDYSRMNKRYLRQQVKYFGPEKAGTIIVDANTKLLYFIQPGGMAIRYGIAVGKEGFGWTGNAIVQWKQEWPTWTPPASMIQRKPELAKYSEGQEGGPDNPLGARALYLFKNGKDTMYRIHGTNKPFSIGKAASSGCFRMINQDVADLYSRVNGKSRVYVRTRTSQNFAELRNEGR